MELYQRQKPSGNYSSNWYSYVLDKLILNINKLDQIFNKEKINMSEILNYVITDPDTGGNPKYLVENLNITKDYLDRIRKFISKGVWITDDCVSLAKTTDVFIEDLLSKIHNIDYIEDSINILVSDLYDSYFQYVNPDVEHPIVRYKAKYGSDSITGTFMDTYDINNDIAKIKKILESDMLRAYLKRIELIHRDVINLLKEKINPELHYILNLLKDKNAKDKAIK